MSRSLEGAVFRKEHRAAPPGYFAWEAAGLGWLAAAEGWPERAGLHQLHCLLVHALVFGGGYVRHAHDVATRCR